MYVNDEGLYSCQPNRAFYATESMEHEGYYSAIDGKPVVSGLPSSLLFGNIVITGFNPETEALDKSSESLDEMMEQKVEVAEDGEIGDDLGVSNEER